MKETEVIITQTSSKKSERIELQCHVFTAAIYAYTCLIWQETAYAQPSGRRVRFPFAHDSMFSSYGSWLFLDVFRRMVLRMILVYSCHTWGTALTGNTKAPCSVSSFPAFSAFWPKWCSGSLLKSAVSSCRTHGGSWETLTWLLLVAPEECFCLSVLLHLALSSTRCRGSARWGSDGGTDK